MVTPVDGMGETTGVWDQVMSHMDYSSSGSRGRGVLMWQWIDWIPKTDRMGARGKRLAVTCRFGNLIVCVQEHLNKYGLQLENIEYRRKWKNRIKVKWMGMGVFLIHI